MQSGLDQIEGDNTDAIVVIDGTKFHVTVPGSKTQDTGEQPTVATEGGESDLVASSEQCVGMSQTGTATSVHDVCSWLKASLESVEEKSPRKCPSSKRQSCK